MFEYHGWATIRTDVVDAFGDEDEQVLEDIWHALAAQAERIRHSNGMAYLDCRNGLYSLSVAGHNNHRDETVLEVFHWIATHARTSYGMLFIHDDEDVKRGADYSNEFRVWRLALSAFHEHDDPFLSPYVPTVERPS